ncbi:MAG: hypothetical protein IH851_03370 [Armatimonadetes bacterium]|nr:hypothetical protein [Armatimonadota bacterium]
MRRLILFAVLAALGLTQAGALAVSCLCGDQVSKQVPACSAQRSECCCPLSPAPDCKVQVTEADEDQAIPPGWRLPEPAAVVQPSVELQAVVLPSEAAPQIFRPAPRIRLPDLTSCALRAPPRLA